MAVVPAGKSGFYPAIEVPSEPQQDTEETSFGELFGGRPERELEELLAELLGECLDGRELKIRYPGTNEHWVTIRPSLRQ